MGKSYLERAGEGRKALLYTKPMCAWCDKAKALLAEHNIAVEEIPATDHLGLFKQRGWSTVPQVILDGMHVGGFAELEKVLPKKKTGV